MPQSPKPPTASDEPSDTSETASLADGARPRTEVLWLNPACAAALERERAGRGTPLFPHEEEAA